jgi:hypothetical protein
VFTRIWDGFLYTCDGSCTYHVICFALSKVIVHENLKANLAIFQAEVVMPITATNASLNPEVIRNFLILGLYAGIAYHVNKET